MNFDGIRAMSCGTKLTWGWTEGLRPGAARLSPPGQAWPIRTHRFARQPLSTLCSSYRPSEAALAAPLNFAGRCGENTRVLQTCCKRAQRPCALSAPATPCVPPPSQGSRPPARHRLPAPGAPPASMLVPPAAPQCRFRSTHAAPHASRAPAQGGGGGEGVAVGAGGGRCSHPAGPHPPHHRPLHA